LRSDERFTPMQTPRSANPVSLAGFGKCHVSGTGGHGLQIAPGAALPSRAMRAPYQSKTAPHRGAVCVEQKKSR
jgi:hypothetical protein